MFYGFLAAWSILIVYVITLVSRERRIRKDLEKLRSLLEDREQK